MLPPTLPLHPLAIRAQLSRKAQKTVKDIEALGGSITDAQGEVKNVNSRVDDTDMKLAARFEEMNSKLGVQRRQFDDLQAALVETRSSISENPDLFAAINKAVERLDADLGKGNEDRARIEKTMEGLFKKIAVVDKLNKDIMTLVEENHSLQMGLQEVTKSIGQSEEAMMEKDVRLRRVTTNLDTLRQNVDTNVGEARHCLQKCARSAVAVALTMGAVRPPPAPARHAGGGPESSRAQPIQRA